MDVRLAGTAELAAASPAASTSADRNELEAGVAIGAVGAT